MSHNVHTDIVKFIARSVFTELNECFLNASEEEEEISSTGWKHHLWDKNNQTIYNTNYPDIIGEVWIKDNYMVWLVNESQYSCVGDFDTAVISEDKDSVELFLQDNNIQRPIEQNAVVHSWW